MKRALLVTGGLGFIGKNFCRHLDLYYEKKIIIDIGGYASDYDFYERYLSQNWELHTSNFGDLDKFLMHGYHNDIINFAAESHVDKSFTNANIFFETNVLQTLKAVECLRASTCDYRFLHISTDEVYGERVSSAASEEACLQPTNPYSVSKASADLMVQAYKKCFGINVKIVRANNIYGDYQLTEKLIPKAILYAKKKDIFYLHGNQSLKRHFLHTYDFYNALVCILSSWEKDKNFIYNVAGEKSYEVREIVEFLYTLGGLDPSEFVQVGEDRPFNDKDYKIIDDKIRDLNWRPSVPFYETLESMFRNNKILFKNLGL